MLRVPLYGCIIEWCYCVVLYELIVGLQWRLQRSSIWIENNVNSKFMKKRRVGIHRIFIRVMSLASVGLRGYIVHINAGGHDGLRVGIGHSGDVVSRQLHVHGKFRG